MVGRDMDRSRVFVVVRRFMESRVPGYFEVVDMHCRKMFGRGCIDLFIEEPEKLREVLMNKYSNDVHPVYFAIKYLFLRPILLELNKLDVEEELATLFLQNPQKFRERLRQILALPFNP
jgi:hypothetical protein